MLIKISTYLQTQFRFKYRHDDNLKYRQYQQHHYSHGDTNDLYLCCFIIFLTDLLYAQLGLSNGLAILFTWIRTYVI